jgi:hypothetical protein
MKRNILIAFLSVFTLLGCEKDEVVAPKNTSKLIGCWVTPQYEESSNGNTIVLYQRANALSENNAGIQFLNDKALIERKNTGWCGTPPIAYGNFDGKYQWENDSTIVIDVAFWGGTEQQTWNIINLTNTTLKIKILSRDVSYTE